MYNYNGVTTYTFVIVENNDGNAFRNLVLRMEDDIEFEAYIAIYTPTDAWLDADHNTTPYEGQVNMFPFTGTYQTVVTESTVECHFTIEIDWECDAGLNHPPGTPANICNGGAEVVGVRIYEVCSGGTNGGGPDNGGFPFPDPDNPSNGDGTGGNTGGNSNGDGNNLPLDGVMTKPKKELDEDEEEKPCNTLKNLTQNQAYNSPNPYTDDNHPSNPDGKNKKVRLAITNIDDEMFPSNETGYGFYNKGNYPSHGPYAHHVPSNVHNEVHFPSRPYQFGTVHTHPTGSQYYQMFSPKDMNALLEIRDTYSADSFLNFQNQYGDDLFVSVLVVEQAGEIHTYAIKIDDFNQFNATMQQKKVSDESWKSFEKKYKDKIKNDAKSVGGTAAQYQKAFLEFMQSQNLGLALYQMEQTNAGTPFVQEKWKKLELDATNNIKETPCN
jgi:hypothetical protein